jgi:hypothetical protein
VQHYFDYVSRFLYSLASTVLLNRSVAFGTFFGVRHQPVASLGIIGTLLLPQLDVSAGKRLVVLGIAAAVFTQNRRKFSVGIIPKLFRAKTDPKQKSFPQAQWTIGMI